MSYKKRPITRCDLYKDGQLHTIGLYSSTAQTLEVLFKELKPEHKWEIISVVIPPPPEPLPTPEELASQEQDIERLKTHRAKQTGKPMPLPTPVELRQEAMRKFYLGLGPKPE